MAELYEVSRISSQKIYPVGPLADWVKRQSARLDAAGSSWGDWCDLHGISDSVVRKRILKSEHISYLDVDEILTPAGMRPEDLYGWT